MNYIGIDIGASKYFVCQYLSGNRKIKPDKFTDQQTLCQFIAESTKSIIAIDSPSDYCKENCERRKCEIDLGIVGYYATPRKNGQVKEWMISGIELFRFLKKQGFILASSKKRGSLIEVHPTLIFKKAFNQGIPPKQWINQTNPTGKRTPLGIKQRRDFLIKRFPSQERLIHTLSHDYIDALIAAYAADCYHKAKGKAKDLLIGDPNEGQMFFPN